MNPRYVSAKLGNMRKPQEFIVSAYDNGDLQVQSDKSIGEFDPNTGIGKLTTKGPYFHHLAFATPYQFPPEFVEACKAKAFRKGDSISGGVAIFGGMTRITVQPRSPFAVPFDRDSDYWWQWDRNVYPMGA